MIIVGIVIGSGIFLLPNLIARSLPSAGAILSVWIVSGVLSCFGALAYAELGAMMPATGGQYVYLRGNSPFVVGSRPTWTPLSLSPKLPERSSPSRVRFAAPTSCALDRSGPL